MRGTWIVRFVEKRSGRVHSAHGQGFAIDPVAFREAGGVCLECLPRVGMVSTRRTLRTIMVGDGAPCVLLDERNSMSV